MKKSTIILIWGGITAVACSLHKVLLIVQGASLSGWAYLNYLIFLMGMFIAIKQVKDKINGGYMKFGQGYLISLIIIGMMAVAGLITMVITVNMIPDLGERLINEMQVRFVNAGLSQELIDKMMDLYAKAFTPGMMVANSFFQYVFVGAILGLIAAGINTKKKPMFDNPDGSQEG